MGIDVIGHGLKATPAFTKAGTAVEANTLGESALAKRCAADSQLQHVLPVRGRIQIKTGNASEMAIKAISAMSSRRIWWR